jgi:hypothetical protein
MGEDRECRDHDKACRHTEAGNLIGIGFGKPMTARLH